MAAIIGKTNVEVELLMRMPGGDPVAIGTLTIPLDVVRAVPVGAGERAVVKQTHVTVSSSVDLDELGRQAASTIREALRHG